MPFISIVVPTYKEESVIERKLVNLLSLKWPLALRPICFS